MDHVYPVGRQLETHGLVFIAILVVFLVFLFLVFFQLTFLERLAKVYALEDRVPSFRM